MPEPRSLELIDLYSLEALARKRLGEEKVKLATEMYLSETKQEYDDYPDSGGWVMRGNRPVVIG